MPSGNVIPTWSNDSPAAAPVGARPGAAEDVVTQAECTQADCTLAAIQATMSNELSIDKDVVPSGKPSLMKIVTSPSSPPTRSK